MDKFILDLFDNHPLESGVIFILCGMLLGIYNYKSNKSSFQEQSYFTWKAFSALWLVIYILIIFGITLLFKS